MGIESDGRAHRPFRPAAEHRIADLDTLRVLADPLRFRIVQTMSTRFDEPWTVKRIAGTLEEPVTKLYYHIGLLEERGIVVVTGTRLVSGIVEKQYQLVAERFSIDRTVLSPEDPSAGATFDSILASVMDTTRSDIHAAVRAGVASLHRPEGDDPTAKSVLLMHGVDRLSPANAVDFRKRLRALLDEFGNDAPDRAGNGEYAEIAPAPDAHPYGLVVAFYPMVDAATDGSNE